MGLAVNDECVGCHADQAASWRDSHHGLAMQEASPDTVLGDFEDASFEHQGASIEFFRKGKDFWIRAGDVAGQGQEYPVLYSFGVDPLQQYLIEFPGGRLQALSVAWDVNRRRWYSLDPEDDASSDEAMHWTGRYQTWNAMCAECHSTAFEKNYDSASDTYASTWAEINVSCQSCHGPGAQHVQWARAGAKRPSEAKGLAIDFAPDRPRLEVETCAPCHSRRYPVSASEIMGDPLLDHFVPVTLDEGLYYADGQIQDEVYVYGSFLQSKMYEAGVRCTDCHDPHGLNLRAQGDALCTRCHGPEPDVRFPQLVKRTYASVDHHHHPETSPGARCVACHMPSRTYMGIDLRHDHAFQVPRPDLSHALNVPNVCTQCHTDRTTVWASEKVASWYGLQRIRGAHWASAVHEGRSGGVRALDGLINLMKPGASPDIVRATAVSLAANYGDAATPALQEAARDPNPRVRAAAATALSKYPVVQRMEPLKPLLGDPVRAVRIEAGRGLAAVLPEFLGDRATELRDLALSEYTIAQEAASDLPPARFNLATLYHEQGRDADARAAYRGAIELDPLFLPAVANLAQLESGLGHPDRAEQVLRSGLEAMPEEGELHYSLGLVLAGQAKFGAAAQTLRRAASLLSGRARVHYNLGLAEQRIGASERAEEAFYRAVGLDPMEPDFIRALVILHAQNGEWSKALAPARRLTELEPDSPQAHSLLLRVQSEVESR